MSGLSGPTSLFLNGTHKFSELALARMVLLTDKNRSVPPLRLTKAREPGELWREKNVRAPWTIPFKLVTTSSFRPARPDKKRPKTGYPILETGAKATTDVD